MRVHVHMTCNANIKVGVKPSDKLSALALIAEVELRKQDRWRCGCGPEIFGCGVVWEIGMGSGTGIVGGIHAGGLHCVQ